MTSIPDANNVRVDMATISVQTLVIGNRQMTLTVLRQIPLIYTDELEYAYQHGGEWRVWGKVHRFFVDELVDNTHRSPHYPRTTEADVASSFWHLLILNGGIEMHRSKLLRTYVQIARTFYQPVTPRWNVHDVGFDELIRSLAYDAPQFYLAG